MHSLAMLETLVILLVRERSYFKIENNLCPFYSVCMIAIIVLGQYEIVLFLSHSFAEVQIVSFVFILFIYFCFRKLHVGRSFFCYKQVFFVFIE